MFETKLKKIKEIIPEDLAGSAVFGINTSEITSIKTGGRVICLINIESRKNLLRMVKVLLKNDIRFTVIGSGTNILFNDGYMDMILLKLCSAFDYLKINSSGEIFAGAAYNLQKFVISSAKFGQDFSFLAGIPGMLGGAVIGSSGTGVININNFVKEIKYLSIEGNKEVKEKTAKLDLNNYNYRYFNVPGLCVLTDVSLKGDLLDSSIIFNKIRKNIKEKKLKQPFNTKNLGCFFKNPEGFSLSAGEMIDMCGLKNFWYGGARVSERHANFIENYEKAESKDVYILSKIIKNFVKNKFNRELLYEIKLVGF
jgi:UDP-N-acetylmuramate dehydrogenase